MGIELFADSEVLTPMTLIPGQHVVVHTAHLRADTVRALVFGFLMGICGLVWGWTLFHKTPTVPWIAERYWNFGKFVCNERLAAAARLVDNYFIYRCGDGSQYKERVLLTKDWAGI